MASRVLHITEADLVRDVQGMLLRAQTGTEIIIEGNAQPVAILRAVEPIRRKISECIALARAHEQESGLAPTLDAEFAKDIESIVESREPWNPTSWD